VAEASRRPDEQVKAANMRTRKIAASALIAVALAGCSTNPFSRPQVTEEQIWLRTDGRSGRDDPALAAQFESDKAACTVPGGIDRACMTSRAYILVPKSQAEATAARLRAANSGT
jgi:hypothetical protein